VFDASRILYVLRSFPFGLAAVSMLVLSLLSGAYLLATPPPKKTATLTCWIFAKPHYDAYTKALPAFEKAHPGVKVELQLVANSGLAQRLQAAFQADLDVPDMAEVEISSAGTFFRGPVEHVGFEDITDRVIAERLDKRMVASRFSPYTSRGRIFGLPHDVHPVMIGYRRDIFEENGIRAEDIQTWDDFIAVGKKLTIPGKRYMIEMSDTGRDQIEAWLFQRGGGYFDEAGKVTFDNDIAVETVKWYIPLVADGSKSKIANSLSSSYGAVIAQGMTDGYFVCAVMSDWRTKLFENDIAAIKGKMALMPVPAFEPGGRRTSTWGGTMLGITKKCKNKELAWEFAKFLYLNEKDLAERFSGTAVLPPLRSAWKEPAFNQPNPYWSNQPLGKLYADLAPEVPTQYTSPFVNTAKSKFSEALTTCVQYYKANGDAGFDGFVRQTLKDKADDVRRQIERNPF
jgi:arabinosaccharide transport system substrate-binding protein